MTYLDSVALTSNPQFRSRIMAAIVSAALSIHGEDLPPGQRRTKRSVLAVLILNNPTAVVDRFVWPAAVNPSIAAQGNAAPDSDLDYVVSSVWDDIAGVDPETTTS